MLLVSSSGYYVKIFLFAKQGLVYTTLCSTGTTSIFNFILENLFIIRQVGLHIVKFENNRTSTVKGNNSKRWIDGRSRIVSGDYLSMDFILVTLVLSHSRA